MMEKEFARNNIILLKLPSTDYRRCMADILRCSAKKFNRTCYITVNDPYAVIEKKAEGNAGKVFFIDCVSMKTKKHEPRDNVVFVSSPHALTEISIAVKNALKAGHDVFILDSLSAMFVYEEKLAVLKFVHGLVLAIRETDTKACFVILNEDANEELLKDLSMFVDIVVGLDQHETA